MGTPRTIRQKLGLLAAIYAAAVLANFIISAVLIVSYLQPTLVQARQDAAVQQQIERVQALLRRLDNRIQDFGEPGGNRDSYLAAHLEVLSLTKDLENSLKFGETAELWRDIERTTARQAHLIDATLAQGVGTQEATFDPSGPSVLAATQDELGHLWQQAGQNIVRRRTQSIAQATGMQRKVLAGLVISTAICLGICVAGTVLIKRWMLGPLAELNKAAVQFAHGNLAYQIPSLPRDEIGQLGHELNEMASKIVDLKLVRMNRIRFEAASRKVRELDNLVREPLEEIKVLAARAVEEHASDAEIVASHRTMQNTVDQLNRWLERLQESTATSDPAFESFDPAEIVHSVQAAMQASLQRHHVQIEIDVDPALKKVEGDRAQIEHALLSLVSNAVEASQPDQTVRVQAGPASQDTARWDLCVADDGPGIPADIEDRVGRPFFTTKPEGSGFGLLIVNAVARAHGGNLVIESKEDEGSRFILRLPRRQH